MKKIAIVLVACTLAWDLSGQAAAPAVTSLTAYGGTLQGPARVAIDPAGNIYVTDPKAGGVVVFDGFGRQLTARSGLGRPLGIALDGQGQVFLSDEQAGSVSVFSSEWTLLYKLGAGDGEFQLPNHIAVGPASGGGAVYVSDSRANVVKVYRGQTLVNQFGSPGTNFGQFNFPAGLCVSGAGQVFVVDQNNDRVQVFDASGGFLRTFNLSTSNPGGRSQAALLDSAMRLYVADAYQGTVKVFDAASGALLTAIGSFGDAAGQLSSPGGLALDPFSRLCVASANNGRIELYGLDAFLHVAANVPTRAIAAGTSLLLSATAGGAGPFTFQWQRNGQAINGATDASFGIESVGVADAGSYTVVVTSASGSVTSSIASFAVMAPPTILSGPENRTVMSGTEVVHGVQASGTDLAYQWFYNGLPVEGATDNSLRLADVQPHQAGDYSVRVANSVGSVKSSNALLTVLTAPAQMEIVSAFTRLDLSFQLTVNADPGFSYTLEASTNFMDWQPLTRFVNDAGLFEFTDIEATNFWSRFYRVHWEP